MPCGDFLSWRKRRKGGLNDVEAEERFPLRKGGLNDVEAEKVNPCADRIMSSIIMRWSGNSVSRLEVRVFRDLLANNLSHMGSNSGIKDKLCVSLLKCIYEENVDEFRESIDSISKNEIEGIEIAGQKLLHILCFRQSGTHLELLLSYNVDPNPLDDHGVTPLHLAVSKGWREGVAILLAKGASAKILPVFHRSSTCHFDGLPVLTAARNGDFETSQLLLNENPDLQLTDSKGNTVLHLACYTRCVNLGKLLLENESVLSDISKSNILGYSPLQNLMLGDFTGDLSSHEEEVLECIQLLLQKGVNIHDVNKSSENLLYLAVSANLPSVTKFLLDAGSDPLIKRCDGKTVLHAACQSKSPKCLDLLLKKNSAYWLMFVEDKFNCSPFHVAVSRSSINCCELLLANGDDLTLLD